MLYYLVYFSKAVTLLTSSQLEDLLIESKTWNLEHGITGMLIYLEGKFLSFTEGRFMQVLEGTEEEVNRIFKKIQNDRRHHHILVLNRGTIEKRNFKDWLMGFEKVNLDKNNTVDGFFSLDKTFMQNKDQGSTNKVMSFLKSFYDNA